jgi:hypothetical protein
MKALSCRHILLTSSCTAYQHLLREAASPCWSHVVLNSCPVLLLAAAWR